MSYFQRKIYMAAGDSGGSAASGSAAEGTKETIAAAASTAAEGTEAKSTAATETEKKYSDAEVNAMKAGAKKEAVEKFLKDNGIEPSGNVKDDMAAFKAFRDSQKTELDKEKERATAAETAKTAAETRANKAEAKAEALALGVPKEKVDDFITLAMGEEGDTMAAKVAKALEKRPYFKEAAVPQAPNLSTKIKSQSTPEAQAAANTFNAALGLSQK